jgi:hypothetical protein
MSDYRLLDTVLSHCPGEARWHGPVRPRFSLNGKAADALHLPSIYIVVFPLQSHQHHIQHAQHREICSIPAFVT